MNYELVKQLKEAGFPQGTSSSDIHYTYVDKKNNPCSALVTDSAYIPTLSELIEACDVFPANFLLYGRAQDRWEATKVNSLQPNAEPHCETKYGSTPKEAVAKLWLKLNENGN